MLAAYVTETSGEWNSIYRGQSGGGGEKGVRVCLSVNKPGFHETSMPNIVVIFPSSGRRLRHAAHHQ